MSVADIELYKLSILPEKLTNPFIKFSETGRWIYRYYVNNMQVIHKDPENQEESNKTFYQYLDIYYDTKPTYEQAVQTVLREYVSLNEEFDLINSYNRALLDETTLDGQESIESKVALKESIQKAKDAYLEYLDLLSTIKAQVKKDFMNF